MYSAHKLLVYCFISIFLVLGFLLSFSTRVEAADCKAGCDIDATNYKAPENADYSLINLQHSMLCQLGGMSPLSQCIGITKDKKKIKAMLYDRTPGGGAIGGVTSVMTAMYDNKPTSTTQYMAEVGVGFGIVDKAHAQVLGSGSSVAYPILGLWQVVRNFSYVLYIFVFIAVGFMIMFRQKMSAQAVVSIESALPGLVVGLVLVTFSYLIASLLIDLAFFGVQLVAQIFAKNAASVNNVFGDAQQIQSMANNSNIFNFFTSSVRFGQNFSDVSSGTATLLNSVTGGVVGEGAAGGASAFIGAVVFGLIGFLTLGPLGGAAGLIGGGLAPIIIGLIIPVILIFALIVQMVRLLYGLLNAYVALLVMTAAGPLIILYSSIPGKGGSLSLWWKTILANALVFPAVFAVFMFAGVILGATQDQTWANVPPFFGGLRPDLIRVIIGYAIVLGTPAIPGMVKNAFGVKDFGEITKMAAENFGLGAAGAGATATLFGRPTAKGVLTALGGQTTQGIERPDWQMRGARMIERAARVTPGNRDKHWLTTD